MNWDLKLKLKSCKDPDLIMFHDFTGQFYAGEIQHRKRLIL